MQYPTMNERLDYAFELIMGAHTVTILSLDEMKDVIFRSMMGEFDEDILKRKRVN